MWSKVKGWLSPFAGPSVAPGTAADIATHLQRLLDAPEGSSLTIEVAGVEDAFVQFTAAPESIQIDQPLITARQVGREAALREVFTTGGLIPYESRGSDGSRFLDCDLPRDSAAAAIAVARVLQSVFGVGASTELRFVGNGIAPTG